MFRAKILQNLINPSFLVEAKLRYTCAYYPRPDMSLDEAQEARNCSVDLGFLSGVYEVTKFEVGT